MRMMTSIRPSDIFDPPMVIVCLAYWIHHHPSMRSLKRHTFAWFR
jgi:hypothetical protein